MKVMTILGTRPEIIRLSQVMRRLDQSAVIEHVLVHTGQNYDYELNEVFFSDLDVKAPDHFLDVSRESLGQAYGDILAKSEAVLLEEAPNAVLILGDTNSAIAAIIAKRMHIPVFHMEAGNRSFDHNVPEEVNRRIVDHTADFNLVYTEHARRNLLAEGLPARRIYLTGSPMREVLDRQRPQIEASTITADLGYTPGGYFLVSAHRQENVDVPDRLDMLLETLAQLSDDHGLPVLVSLHPRTKNRLGDRDLPDGIVLHKPFGFTDYNRLQLDARCVLSDSGTITEEASLLGFPAVTIRDSIERPEGLDTGSIVLCGLDYPSVSTAVSVVSDRVPTQTPGDYQISDTSERVIRLIVGLIGRSAFWSGIHLNGVNRG